MPPGIHRRNFLYLGAAAGGGALALYRFGWHTSEGAMRAQLAAGDGEGGYGALRPGAAANTGDILLALPEGFRYTVFGRRGEPMSDGHPTPHAHDGMAAFAAPDGIRLVRNHEVRPREAGRAFGDPRRAYDPQAGGGTTTLVVDPATRLPVRSFVSLGGTLVNCAGGPTPWGSWITCEETLAGSGVSTDMWGRATNTMARDHGYCFEVPAHSDGQAEPVPLTAMGRFVHEAIAVDPETGIIYQTEDQRSSGFYRFIPRTPGVLAEGGRLQMLAVAGRPRYDTRTGQTVGEPLDVQWVDIAEPDPRDAAGTRAAVFAQGAALGGAGFARLEGCWYGNRRIYINATSGGDAGVGQVWEYEPAADGGVLRLLFESPGPAVLNAPDNVCVSPRGGILLCEDGGGPQHMRGLTRDGRIFDFARNIEPSGRHGEFAGATFSPDGQTLFVNIQIPGMTLAIWGPWERGAL